LSAAAEDGDWRLLLLRRLRLLLRRHEGRDRHRDRQANERAKRPVAA
jgi:hypothetical protein